MTATIFLIRHAAHGHIGHTLSGRQRELPLSDTGRRQALALAGYLAPTEFAAIQSSPIERACQTANAIAVGRQELTVETVPALTEIDFGEWTGKPFTTLEGDPRWAGWNRYRSRASAPGGESMQQVQARAVAHVLNAAETYAGRRVLMVSHCDVIRAVLCHALGLTLDNILRFDVDPASISVIQAGDWGMRVTRMNETITA